MPDQIPTPPSFYDMLNEEPLVVVLPPNVCPVPYPPVPCVPEPSCVALVVAGLLLCMRLRRA